MLASFCFDPLWYREMFKPNIDFSAPSADIFHLSLFMSINMHAKLDYSVQLVGDSLGDLN